MPTTLEVYEKVKAKLDAEIARTLIEYIQESVEKGSATKKDLAETESRLSDRIANCEKELSDRISNVEKGLNDRIANVEKRMSDRIAELERRMAALEIKLMNRLYGGFAILAGLVLLSNPDGFLKSLKFLIGLFS